MTQEEINKQLIALQDSINNYLIDQHIIVDVKSINYANPIFLYASDELIELAKKTTFFNFHKVPIVYLLQEYTRSILKYNVMIKHTHDTGGLKWKYLYEPISNKDFMDTMNYLHKTNQIGCNIIYNIKDSYEKALDAGLIAVFKIVTRNQE